MGYSYYKYANSLKEQEKYTALIYLEYALEMSDLGIYFPEEKSNLDKFVEGYRVQTKWFYFFIGILVGLVVSSIIFFFEVRRRPKLKLVK